MAFAIPESSRPARDAMRAGIVRLGGAPVQGGLYVSPNAWEAHVAKLAADLEVSQHLSVMTTTDRRVGELTAPAAISVRLWPLDDIAERYQHLLNLAEKRRAQLRGRHKLSRTEYLTIALELAAEFTAAMEPDPLLPSELLPGAWIGARARAVFAQCWIELRAMTDETVPQLFQNYADAIRSHGYVASLDRTGCDQRHPNKFDDLRNLRMPIRLVRPISGLRREEPTMIRRLAFIVATAAMAVAPLIALAAAPAFAPAAAADASPAIAAVSQLV